MKKVILSTITIMVAIVGINYFVNLENNKVNVSYDSSYKKDISYSAPKSYDNNDVEEVYEPSIIVVNDDDNSKNITSNNNVQEFNNDVVKNNFSNNNDVARENNNETVQDAVIEDKTATNNDNTSSSDKQIIEEKKTESNLKKVEKLQPIESNKKVIVIDKSNGTMCAQAIEYFYEDTYYRYYFTCIKSPYMYVIKNGKEYKLVEALNNGIVTMQELEQNGYSFPKKAKNVLVK